MDFLELGKEIIKRGAPILGAALIPGGAVVGSMIANAFGAKNDPKDIIEKINSDPNANIKLLDMQQSYHLELEKLALQGQAQENADRADARSANVKNTKITDEIIKCYLVISVSVVIFACLHAIIYGEVSPAESTLVATILGAAITAWLAMIYFYFGSSSSSKAKDTAMMAAMNR
jgi:hypothetical protein